MLVNDGVLPLLVGDEVVSDQLLLPRIGKVSRDRLFPGCVAEFVASLFHGPETLLLSSDLTEFEDVPT